jgi:PncC family amidohydrolase
MQTDLELAQEALEVIADKRLNPSEYEFARALVALLKAANLKLSTAESLTGGMAAELVTAIPGSSSVFSLGVVAYSAEAKQDLLQVAPAEVARTTISAEVASQMAEGVLRLSQADLAISCTGVAGPDPVGRHQPGEVHIALVRPGHTRSVQLVLAGGRDEIRVQTCIAMFGLAIDALVTTLGISKP